MAFLTSLFSGFVRFLEALQMAFQVCSQCSASNQRELLTVPSSLQLQSFSSVASSRGSSSSPLSVSSSFSGPNSRTFWIFHKRIVIILFLNELKSSITQLFFFFSELEWEIPVL